MDAEALKTRRLEARRLLDDGVAQAEVARRLKISRQSVSRWAQVSRRELAKVRRQGRKSKLDEVKRSKLRTALLAGPQAAGAPRGGGNPPPAPALIPAHCQLQIVLKPTSDSLINMEIWLPPADKWNGKFMGVGNGGFAGSIQGLANDMPQALRLGYATAGNDTGHSEADGPGGMFGLGHPEKIVDFAYRAMHEMTAQSKRIIDAHYGRAPQFSYYKGCSTGGRQGVMAAQRYPEDFDGIIAGALANRHIHQHTAGVYRRIELGTIASFPAPAGNV